MKKSLRTSINVFLEGLQPNKTARSLPLTHIEMTGFYMVATLTIIKCEHNKK